MFKALYHFDLQNEISNKQASIGNGIDPFN